jgi:hypothetical protein
MSGRFERAAQLLREGSSLPAYAMTIVPWMDGNEVELRAWIDPAFLHAAKNIPLTVQGIQIRIFAMPLGVPHIRTLRC